MHQRWETLTFLHWSYPVEAIQVLLPPGITVQEWEGRAWVGMVPFYMRIRPPGGPTAMRFPQTNLRTYVTGPDGQPGVWFLSLDAARAPAVLAARGIFRLAYQTAAMELDRSGDTITYRSRRRRGPRAGAGHEIVIAASEALAPDEVSEFDNYLTARYRFWSLFDRRPISWPVEHPPWPLRRATVLRIHEDLTAAAGLAAPAAGPLVHFSEGVEVRIGWPRSAH